MKKHLVLRFIKALSLVAALATALLPINVRFYALARLAFFLSPLRKWLPSSTTHLNTIVSATDDMLYAILSVLASRSRLKYNLGLHGDREIVPEIDVPEGGSGLLIVGAHTMLIYLVIRHMHDLGHGPWVVAEDTNRKIYGTQVLPSYIGKTRHILVRVKRALEGRNTVIALCDSVHAIPHANPVDLGAGPFWVSKMLMQVAGKTGARILFVHPRVNRGRLELVWGRPPPGETSLDAIMDAFAAFLAAQIRFTAARFQAQRQPMDALER